MNSQGTLLRTVFSASKPIPCLILIQGRQRAWHEHLKDMMAFKGKSTTPCLTGQNGDMVGVLSKGATCAEAGVGINIYVPHVCA